MNSSGMQPESGGEETRSQEIDRESTDKSSEELLEMVLEETLAAASSEAVFPTILRFVRRNQDRTITDPDVAEALIHEILEQRVKRMVLPDDCHRWVAETLLEDPNSRERLEGIWNLALNECK